MCLTTHFDHLRGLVEKEAYGGGEILAETFIVLNNYGTAKTLNDERI